MRKHGQRVVRVYLGPDVVQGLAALRAHCGSCSFRRYTMTASLTIAARFVEGLMMGTRSGDVDPSVVGFLARAEGVDVGEVEGWLNTRSGLLGVSRHSQDMRELLEAERLGDANAALAVEMFCYRVRKYIGAYMAVLGGADAVAFGGGIGENAPTVRVRICAGMDWYGLTLDRDRNLATLGSEARISADDARVHLYVIPVDEAWIIAADTISCLRHRRE